MYPWTHNCGSNTTTPLDCKLVEINKTFDAMISVNATDCVIERMKSHDKLIPRSKLFNVGRRCSCHGECDQDLSRYNTSGVIQCLLNELKHLWIICSVAHISGGIPDKDHLIHESRIWEDLGNHICDESDKTAVWMLHVFGVQSLEHLRLVLDT